MLKVGQNIRINGQVGIIVYVNRLLRCYQVNFGGKRESLISFDVVGKEKTTFRGMK
jgi:hypothetical protein